MRDWQWLLLIILRSAPDNGRSIDLTPRLVSGRASTPSVADSDGFLRIFCMITAGSSPVLGSLLCRGTARLSQSDVGCFEVGYHNHNKKAKRYLSNSRSNHTTIQLCGLEYWSKKWLFFFHEATSDGDETRRDRICRAMLLSRCPQRLFADEASCFFEIPRDPSSQGIERP